MFLIYVMKLNLFQGNMTKILIGIGSKYHMPIDHNFMFKISFITSIVSLANFDLEINYEIERKNICTQQL